MNSSWMGFLLIVLASFFWAFDALIRYPLIEQGFSALHVVFVEHFLLVSILLIYNFRDLSFFKKIDWATLGAFFVVGGIGSALATLSFTRAFYFLNPSLVILLQKFQPLLAIILASYFLKEKIHLSFVLWAIVCLFGGFLISYPDVIQMFHLLKNHHNFFQALFGKDSFAIGYLLVLFSIVGWASATVFSRFLVLKKLITSEILLGRFLMGLLFLMPLLALDDSIITKFSTYDMSFYLKIILMIFISGIFAMTLYYQGIKNISAKYATLAEMFFPLMAVIINWFFLEQKLQPIQLVGGSLLVLGSLVIQMKKY